MVLQAIQSFMDQKLQDVEIIVVDDGSTDNTCKEVASLHPDIKIVRQKGIGPGRARNVGADVAKGDFLMFLDSDDLWLDDHAAKLLKVLSRGFEVAYGTTSTIDEVNGGQFLIPENGKGNEGDCFTEMLRWCFMVPSSIAVSCKAFWDVGGFGDEQCGEDWTFFTRLAARYPFGFVGSEPITVRRLHQGSLCCMSDKKKLLAIVNQVYTLLENETRATDADRNHFKKLAQWTADHDMQWTTVQDWYQTMLQEKII
jgi:glycosyltransferase involved in cell wall biosynthesis